ncbi:MAG: 30S ribosome-binding factor RbfA [Clostridia bacterium]|nr:30S ribosome-binding factor RbfA [Clostridia bacterium]
MAGYRIDRVSEDIKRELAAIIRELKDPRVQGKMLTVVNVDVSSDASYAKVYVSAMEGLDTAKVAVKGLVSATGYIRREVGKRLHLRKTPELKFVADNSIEIGMGITGMLNNMVIKEFEDDSDED